MNKRGKIRYAFVSSYTSQGFYSFIPQLVNDLKKVYVLKGAPGTGKSTFVRMVGEVMFQQGYDVEFWLSSHDPVTPDGVYLPQLDAAIINGSLPQPLEPRYPEIKEFIINLGDYLDRAAVGENYHEIIDRFDHIEALQMRIGGTLQEASRVKEEIRKANSAHLNLEKIDQLVQKMSARIMENRPGEKHYFAGTITSEGLVDYIENLSADCKERYIFEGPVGSGKSTVIQELVREAKQRGYFLEYYHCGLEVDYLIMVVIRNLQVALIDAGPVKIRTKPGDTVMDMTECLDRCDSDDVAIKNSQALRRYEALLLQAQQELEKIRHTNREIKKVYTPAMDFDRLDRKRLQVTDEINKG